MSFLFPQINVEGFWHEEERPASLEYSSRTKTLNDFLKPRPSYRRIDLANLFGDVYRFFSYRSFITKSAEQGQMLGDTIDLPCEPFLPATVAMQEPRPNWHRGWWFQDVVWICPQIVSDGQRNTRRPFANRDPSIDLS